MQRAKHLRSGVFETRLSARRPVATRFSNVKNGQVLQGDGFLKLVITQAAFANDGGIECCNENGVDSAFGKGNVNVF